MPGPTAQEIDDIRMSRVAILQRLIAFARALLDDLVARMDVNAFCRIARWIRIAIVLKVHIRNGALDQPREPRKARRRADPDTDPNADIEAEAAAELASLRPERPFTAELGDARALAREQAVVEAYLDRPFGEVVALICKGIGMTPDWDAWANEPWAQEEVRTQPPGSPYAGYAGDPPVATRRPEREALSSPERSGGGGP